MAEWEIFEPRLSEAERDALFAQLDAAAAYLGADKPAKLPIPNGDGTWDVGCTLEGDDIMGQPPQAATPFRPHFETEASVTMKLRRGTFAAAWLFACIAALGLEGIRLEEL